MPGIATWLTIWWNVELAGLTSTIAMRACDSVPVTLVAGQALTVGEAGQTFWFRCLPNCR